MSHIPIRIIIPFAITLVAQIAIGQPPPRVIDRDPDDGSPVVYRFDTIELHDGTTLYANPSWTKDQQRPIASPPNSILYIPHDRDRGGWGIDKSQIKRFTYWEAQATQVAKAYMERGRYDVAGFIINDLVDFNPRWASVRDLQTRMQTHVALEQMDNGDIQGGLKSLNQIRNADPSNRWFQKQYTRTLIDRATTSLGSEDEDQPLRYLNEVERAYPSDTEVQKLTLAWTLQAEELIDHAESLQKSDTGAAIAAASRAIQLSDRSDLRSRCRIVIRNVEGLLVACFEPPGVFEPINATRPIERQCNHLMFDYLVARDPGDNNYSATGLVDSIEQQNLGQNFEVTLAKDRTFSDGSPITAADLSRTIELLSDPRGEAYDRLWAQTVGAPRLIGPRQLRLPVAPHPRPETLLSIPVLCRSDFPALPSRGQASTRPKAVSGPFRLGSIDSLGEVELLANGKFRRPPRIGKVTLKPYEPRNREQAFRDLTNGKVHLVPNPSPIQLDKLRADKSRYRTRRVESNTVWILGFNHRSDIFGAAVHPAGEVASRHVRRAVALSIDRQSILDQYFNLARSTGQGHSVITGPFPRQSPAHDRDVQTREVQPEVATELVKEHAAGVLNGRRLTLKYAGAGEEVELAMAQIKRSLEAVGLPIDLQMRPPAAFDREIRDGSYDLAYLPIRHDNVLFDLSGYFPSAGATAAGPDDNLLRYRNQSLSQMFEQLRLSTGGRGLWDVQHRIHQWMHSEVVFVPLWQLDQYIVHTNRLVAVDAAGKEGQVPIDDEYLFADVASWYLHPAE